MDAHHHDRRKPVLIITGPTACGKSALALALGEHLGAHIINADSVQVYSDLRIVSARPDDADCARVPHHLYGILDGADMCNAERWRRLALAAIAAAHARGRLPLLCGGTGFYLKAMLEGLAPIPDIPPDIRQRIRDAMQADGLTESRRRLAERDPESAARLHPRDGQRIARALEVYEATGRPIGYWHGLKKDGPPPGLRFVTCVMAPDMAALADSISARFQGMLAAGVMDEMARLRRRNLAPDLPVMKAVGVPQLLGVLSGEHDLAEGVRQAESATRQYAKRQLTWIRGQIHADKHIPARFSATMPGDILAFLRENRLTP